LPEALTFDRDPRFGGSWAGRDFPSALVRFLTCLGVEAQVTPPQRPDLNPFVERFHRTLEYECLQRYQPKNTSETQEVLERFRYTYNHERPNQAVTCGNLPPYQAFPALPALPLPPDVVDPDRWVDAVHNACFKRRVNANGVVQVDKHHYYVKRALKGRYVVLRVDATERQFVVELDGQPIKRIPIKGLQGEVLPFQAYLSLMQQEALSERRLWLRRALR
jgi:hypothetical protein